MSGPRAHKIDNLNFVILGETLTLNNNNNKNKQLKKDGF
jgi:hypothetical protein